MKLDDDDDDDVVDDDIVVAIGIGLVEVFSSISPFGFGPRFLAAS